MEVIMIELLTRKQAAETLGISLNTLDAERNSGRLAFIQYKRGGKVWISKEALEEYLARATHQTRPERAVQGTYRKKRV